MKRTMFVLAVLMVAAVWSVAADYGLDRWGDGDGFWSGGASPVARQNALRRGLEYAGAPAAQIEQAVALLKKTSTAQEQRYNRLRVLTRDIRVAYNANNPDAAAIQKLVNEADSLRSEIRSTELTTSLDIRGIVGDTVWNRLAFGYGDGYGDGYGYDDGYYDGDYRHRYGYDRRRYRRRWR